MTTEKILGPRIGAHKSIAKSIDFAVDRGIQSTCECLQIFTRPPRKWEAGKLTLSADVIDRFIQKSKEANYFDTAIHMPYLPNLAAPEDILFEKSVEVLIQELEKMPLLQVPYVVTHLGSPKDRDEEFAAKRVAEAINRSLNHIKRPSMILLENSTAKRKKWGTKIEHFEKILGYITEEKSIGICFDTAHAFSAGYDISTPEGLNEVIDQLEDKIGKNKLRMFHINDSKGPLGSGIDHHEHIGHGFIGLDCFKELMQNLRFKKYPMILETPKDDKIGDFQNLELLRKLRSKNNY